MVRFWYGFVPLMLIGWNSQVIAAIRPSFSFADSTWNATDIIVATEGGAIDGKLQVLEVWKGNLRMGNNIVVPELAAFAPKTKRTVTWIRVKNPPLIYVTGSRLILFLKRSTTPQKWQPACVLPNLEKMSNR